MPPLSIVLPNYNYARYLDERIRSLLGQTYRDFELLIVDDASEDNSHEVIEKYRYDKRIHVRYYSENSGTTYQRWNDGAKMATGEYLLIAGADDSCHPTMVDKLVTKLETHRSVGLAYCHTLQIDEEGKVIGSTFHFASKLHANRWSRDYIDSGRNECQYLIVSNQVIPNASCVVMHEQCSSRQGASTSPCLRRRTT